MSDFWLLFDRLLFGLVGFGQARSGEGLGRKFVGQIEVVGGFLEHDAVVFSQGGMDGENHRVSVNALSKAHGKIFVCREADQFVVGGGKAPLMGPGPGPLPDGGVELLDKKIPIYHVAGNHDVSRFPTKETMKWYKKKFGDPWYSFVHKNSLFIVLESNSLIMHKGIDDVYKDQVAWLEKLLAKSKKKKYAHKTVFMHHPLFVKSPDEEHTYHNMPKELRQKLLDLFVGNNIEMVFSGHLHANMYAKYKEMELITTASACHGKRGIRIVKVKGNKIYDNFREL